MTEKNKTIAERMKFYRKLRGMTQEELSNACGIDYSQIRRYEAGQRNPKFEQLQNIASALGVGITEFIDIKMDIVGEVISLLAKLDEKSCIKLSGRKKRMEIIFHLPFKFLLMIIPSMKLSQHI